MRKLAILAAAAALPLSAAAAHAQIDYDWTGPYIGVNLGQGRDADFNLNAELDIASDSTFFPGALTGETFPTSRSFGGDGLVGGIQGGFNAQTGMFVWGGEVDIQLSDISSSTSIANAPGGDTANPDGFTDLRFEVDYFATARARAGVAMDRFLIYATGGYAYGRVDFDRNYRVGSAELTASANANRHGWTYGAGAEYALGDFWTVRAEYLKVDLGSDQFDTAYSDGTIGRATIDTEFDVIRAGLNLRF
ncbi:outer membrane protein [Glycocaulis sp.]